MHLKRRVPGAKVGPVADCFRTIAGRQLPGSSFVLFVHVLGAGGDFYPFPHLHCLLFAPSHPTDGQLATIDRNVTHTLRPRFPDLEFKEWRLHDNPPAMIVYGYKAREQDRYLPVDKLPQAGDRYRLRYGFPVRGSRGHKAGAVSALTPLPKAA
jgi:hypothetical protein